MKRSKKVFVVVGILFIVATILVGYDIATKTSFPGSKTYMEKSIVPEDDDSTTFKAKEIGREEIR